MYISMSRLDIPAARAPELVKAFRGDHRASHDRIDPNFKADIVLRRFEQLHTYEVVTE